MRSATNLFVFLWSNLQLGAGAIMMAVARREGRSTVAGGLLGYRKSLLNHVFSCEVPTNALQASTHSVISTWGLSSRISSRVLTRQPNSVDLTSAMSSFFATSSRCSPYPVAHHLQLRCDANWSALCDSGILVST